MSQFSSVQDLVLEVGELRGTVRALTAQVHALHNDVKTLNAVLNQGRGVKWFLLALPIVIGTLSGVAGYFGVKLTIGH